MTKLDHSKIITNKKLKEPDYDSLPQPRPVVDFTPKITEREAKEKTQINQNSLEEKLVFVESEKFDGIILASTKHDLLKEIEDLIHELRSFTYRSARLADNDPLVIKARAVVKLRRSLLPSLPSKGLGLSPIPRSKDRTQNSRTNRKRNPR